MGDTPRDETLKQAYAELQRSRTGGEPADAATVQALAAGEYRGADRAELLEKVLAHPRTSAEFNFFLDLAAARPKVKRRAPAHLAAAAVIVILAGTALWYRTIDESEPMRSELDDFLSTPAVDAILAEDAPFAWRAVDRAESYQFQLLDHDGNPVYDVATPDTTLILPRSLSLAPGVYVWLVGARLADGTESRAPPRRVRVR